MTVAKLQVELHTDDDKISVTETLTGIHLCHVSQMVSSSTSLPFSASINLQVADYSIS